MSRDLGRNDPCWCGSGKKYKRCHLQADEQADVQGGGQRGQLLTTEGESLPSSTQHPQQSEMTEDPWSEDEDEALLDEPESGPADERWERFEGADLNEQIAIYQETLDTADDFSDEEAFEMLTTIRDGLKGDDDPDARRRYAELAQQLQEKAPEIYEQSITYYLHNLATDAASDGRWEDLPELLQPFSGKPSLDIDIFLDIVEMLKYHGQNHLLVRLIQQGREDVEKKVESGEILETVIDELASELVQATIANYVETTENPRWEDPALQEQFPAPYREGLNEPWLREMIQHISASEPSDWSTEDFDSRVDAEQWEKNLEQLFFEFMAEQHRRVRVPLGRGEMARQVLVGRLVEQLASPDASARRSPRRVRRHRQTAKKVTITPASSFLIPKRNALDRRLAEFLGFFGSRPYRVAATLELLPAYLHFLTRLGLIHPTEMDRELKNLAEIARPGVQLVHSYGADTNTSANVEQAWSDEALAELRNDPALQAARETPRESGETITITRRPGVIRTCTFLVTYLRDEEVWRKIELREDQTLHDLHRAIQRAVDFDEDHLYSFYLSGRAWDEATDYSSPRASGRSAARMKVEDLNLRMKQSILYLFDYGDEHHFKVQLVDTNPDAPKANYPRITERHGRDPNQYATWGEEDDWDEDDRDEENE